MKPMNEDLTPVPNLIAIAAILAVGGMITFAGLWKLAELAVWAARGIF